MRAAIFDQMTREHIDCMLSTLPLGRFGNLAEMSALVVEGELGAVFPYNNRAALVEGQRKVSIVCNTSVLTDIL